MFQIFKNFLKHSFVYSISNVAVKASGIILLPIYTNYFSVEEFGRLGLILAIVIIMTQIVVLGQGQSIIIWRMECKINSVFIVDSCNYFNNNLHHNS